MESHRAAWQAQLKRREKVFLAFKALSGLTAFFMMLGTSYLLVEAFGVLPFMASLSFGFWPIFIVPMAVVAGSAYGLLTFNALTDMCNDDIFNKRFDKIKQDWEKLNLT